MTEIDDKFREIYRLAVYAVFFNCEEIKFYVSQKNSLLDQILDNFKVGSYCLITAYNPQSKELSESENIGRQRRLSAELHELGYSFLEGYGGSKDDTWPREPGFFVIGISEVDAVSLALKYEQHAIVYGEKGSEPRLVWCD